MLSDVGGRGITKASQMTDKNFDRSLGKGYAVERGNTNMTSTLRGKGGGGLRQK